MEFNEQKVQDYLKQKFQGRDSFLENIIFPIFGEDNFEEGYDAELLDDPGVRHDAEKVGIRSIITYGRVGIDLGSVQIFDITVTDHVLLARNRVTVQGIIRRILGTFQGAFMIFHYADTERWDWRFSFCCKGDKDITEAKRFTFLLGPNQSCRTAAQNFVKLAASASASASPTMDDIKRAFDVEALSNEFFAKYKTYYEGIVKYITGKCFKKIGGKWKEVSEGVPNKEIYAQFDHDDKAVRDYVKKMLGRIVFLHFLQKKGWLGAKKSWDDGDREFMLHLYDHASDSQKNDFLDAVLEPLFDRALDVDRSARGDVFDTGISGIGKVKIPYLNGGLFTRDAADEKAVRLPCEYFHNFLVFLSQYNFTIDENDPSDAEVGVDPEMLSRIFENLLEDNKDKGAIYTPKPIVEYMCRQSLIAYLQTDMPEAEYAAIERFVKTYDPSDLTKKTASTIDKKLKSVKICDPAIGSGAFPMGMLRELYFCRTALEEDLGNHRPAEIKRQIIQENIYGVDIEKGAVDIARLRFWLALVVDEPTPHALPNLDFKIMQGNSLLENYKGVPLDSLLQDRRPVSKKAKQGKFAFDTRETNTQDELALGGESASHAITALMGEYYSTDNREHKQQILSAINDQVKGYIKGQINNSDLNAEIDALECQNDKFFLWHTWFADVFARGGFDIVIANPPYIRELDNSRVFEAIKGSALWDKYHQGKMDYWFFFLHKAIEIVRPNAIINFITSRYWLNSTGANKLIRHINNELSFLQIIDIGDLKIFDNVMGKHMIAIYRKCINSDCLYRVMGDDVSNLTVSRFMSERIIKRNDLMSINSAACEIRLEDCAESGAMKRIEKAFSNNLIKATQGIVENPGLLTKKGIESVGKLGIDVSRHKIGEEVFVISKDTILKLGLSHDEMGLLRPYHFPNEIHRYFYDKSSSRYLIYATKDTIKNIDAYPSIKRHLLRYKCFMEQRRETKKGSNQWFHLHWPREESVFLNPKIIYPQMARSPTFAFVEEPYFVNMATNVITGMDVDKLKTLVAILNSKVGQFWIMNRAKKRGAGYDISVSVINRFPVKSEWLHDEKLIIAVDQILAAKKADPNADTSALESQIDEKVFDLYGLTDDEIAIVEGRNETKQEPQGETTRRPSASPLKRRQVTTSAPSAPTDDEVLE